MDKTLKHNAQWQKQTLKGVIDHDEVYYTFKIYT